MESAFARLYRTSKLASYDRGIKQVYATYAEAAVKGDWGLKRKMPPKISTRLMTVDSLDTKEQITQFESANQQFMMVNAWKENFPESQSPEHNKNSIIGRYTTGQDQAAEENVKPTGPQVNLALMTRAEWQQFLAEARSRRGEWKESLMEGRFAPEETLAFMNATNMRDSQDDGIRRLPTYHDYVPASEELQVQGRVLNRAAAGYAVAVQGIIAYLPLQNHSSDGGYQTRDVKTFYVHSAKFDTQGRPDVILGIRPRGARESSIAFDSGSRSSFAFNKGRGGSGKYQNAHLERIKDILKLNTALKGNDGSEAASKDEFANALDHITKDGNNNKDGKW
ncbi:hypothetical protein LPJ66_002434 [Kickxella alabastrina]|uniref:Uncharacterized protein n=1 Tax=Kickxella alabastrina TaxID=61397 RepID=A0ACC1IQS1_9FUNG|nr:hypothetical protein LPJ66_002434 [Kickxella alabastrina]